MWLKLKSQSIEFLYFRCLLFLSRQTRVRCIAKNINFWQQKKHPPFNCSGKQSYSSPRAQIPLCLSINRSRKRGPNCVTSYSDVTNDRWVENSGICSARWKISDLLLNYLLNNTYECIHIKSVQCLFLKIKRVINNKWTAIKQLISFNYYFRHSLYFIFYWR